MTWHLHDGRESCHVGLKSDLFRGILLSKQFMDYKKYYFNVKSSSRNKFTLLYQNSVTDFLLVSVRHVGAHPGGHQHGVTIQISINLRKTFLRISRIRKIRLT